jgi:hypothetical protein
LVDFVAFFAFFFFAAMWRTPKNFGRPTNKFDSRRAGAPGGHDRDEASADSPSTPNDGSDFLVAETCLAFLRGLLVPSVRVARRSGKRFVTCSTPHGDVDARIEAGFAFFRQDELVVIAYPSPAKGGRWRSTVMLRYNRSL